MVIYELWRLSVAFVIVVVPSGVYKWSINPFINPNPAYNHPPLRENVKFVFIL
jgi:hypothetical protein